MCADSHEWRGELQRERGGALGAEPLSPPARHHLLPIPTRAQHPVGIYITYTYPTLYMFMYMVKMTDACGLGMDPLLTKASTYVRCHRVTVYVRLTLTHVYVNQP